MTLKRTVLDRTTFTHSHHITLSNIPKARRAMGRDVPVSLLEPFVLSDEMEIISSDDDGSLHFHLLNDSGQDSAANLDEASERALFVNVIALFGFVGSLESETNVLRITDLRFLAAQEVLFAVKKNILLLLKGSFSLIRHFYIKQCFTLFKQIETTQL